MDKYVLEANLSRYGKTDPSLAAVDREDCFHNSETRGPADRNRDVVLTVDACDGLLSNVSDEASTGRSSKASHATKICLVFHPLPSKISYPKTLGSLYKNLFSIQKL